MWIEILNMVVKLVQAGIMSRSEARVFIRELKDDSPFEGYLNEIDDHKLIE